LSRSALGAKWSREELSVLDRLKTPERVQRFLDEELLYNKEPDGETCRSPRRVLRDRVAHCAEAAFLAAASFRRAGRPPLVLLLRAERDDDHVLALFREKRTDGAWGAVAKSNYAGLRYREPVYRTLRELAMSYFDHYYNLEAEKSLRARGHARNLSRFDSIGWERSEEDLWLVSDALALGAMVPLVTSRQTKRLVRIDSRLEAAGLHGAVDPPTLWAGRSKAAR
jgi:hypothetical protein